VYVLFSFRFEGFANSLQWMYGLVTGCIDPSIFDRINPDDDGGQYDSSGGSEGTGIQLGACEG
jgi:hypothetical protein